MKKYLLIFLIINCFGLAQVQIKGFSDCYQAIQLQGDQDYLATRCRIRLEVEHYADNVLLFGSFNALKNHFIQQNEVQLCEAFMEYSATNWDLRLGRQIIIWGKADGLEIIDIVSPKDFSEYLNRDYADIRLPVTALKARYLLSNLTFEFIWLPVFEAAVYPQNRIFQNHQINYQENLPAKNLQNSETALRLSGYFSGIDLSLSHFRTWSDFPTVTKEIQGTTINLTANYHRLAVTGLEFSKPVNDLVLRSEIAFYKGSFYESSQDNSFYEKDTYKGMLGLDWYPGNSWTLILQYADTYIANHNKNIDNPEHSSLFTLNVSKKILHDTLVLSSIFYYGLNYQDYFNRSSIAYALTDQFSLTVGADTFNGSQKGNFGKYRDNNQLWLKAKYNF